MRVFATLLPTLFATLIRTFKKKKKVYFEPNKTGKNLRSNSTMLSIIFLPFGVQV